MNLFATKSAPAPSAALPEAPPSLEQVFNGAQAATAYARSIFTEAVEELVAANDALDDVEARATSEIDRLTALRDEAAAQRGANVVTITNLQALIG